MAGKGGGAWKVAYADFVTAMMAFFLVMWICAQDQKIKESVSHYFRDPLGGTPFGTASQPSKSGSIFESNSGGSVPKNEGVANSRGRSSHTSRGEHGVMTKLVADWLHTSEDANTYWRTQATKHLKAAAFAADVRNKTVNADEWAVRQLANQMSQELSGKTPKNAKDLHQDLLQAAFSDVNWVELAEDIIAKADGD